MEASITALIYQLMKEDKPYKWNVGFHKSSSKTAKYRNFTASKLRKKN